MRSRTRWTPWTGPLAASILAAAVAVARVPLDDGQLWRWVVGGGAAGATTAGETVLRGTVGQALVGDQDAPDAGARFGYWQPGSTVVGAPDAATPDRTRLLQNAPNPFNPVTTIRFELATAGRARLRVFDVRGRQVADLLDAALPAGRHHVVFEPHDLASGIYFYELRHGATREVRRLTLVK